MSVRREVLGAATALLFTSCQQGAPAPPGPGLGPAGARRCEPLAYFEATARPQVFSRCSKCHLPGRAAGGTRFVLSAPGAPDAAALDFAIAGTAARALQRDGTSLLLLKPTGRVAHGGGALIAQDSPEEAVLEEMVRRFVDPALTASCSGVAPSGSGVVLADARRTLRKAAIELAGRLPSDAELAAAAASDPETLSGLDPLLLEMMSEDAFHERLLEMWNDLLLTDKSRFEATYDWLPILGVPTRLRAASYCDNLHWQSYDERTRSAESRVCIGAAEALAREPLEIIAHVVKKGRPFSEILTAQYRLFNVHVATLFGLDLAPFEGHEGDPGYFVETRFPAMHGPRGLPEEYAGLLTTTSFLYRYKSTSSNRNRGRAHQVFKLFLDHDVMKSAPRLDLSSIDPRKSPWRHDPQCTGCHAGVDAVAGAFQHWTDCYDNNQVEYFTDRHCDGAWFPERDMFPPGVGPGEQRRLGAAELPTALAHLAAAIVKDPAFSRAVAAHVLTNLTGHERLSPPTDPAAPGYAALAAAHDAQQRTIEALARGFAASGLDFKRLVIAVIKTPAFRAIDADRAGRLELTGLGGGSLLTPEVLHRKIGATLGGTWSDPAATPSLRDPPHHLLSLQRYRIFAGGIDSLGVRQRARTPGSVNMSVATRMALELACERTAADFALDRKDRRLFPLVDRDLAPSGDPRAPGQRPILDDLRHLHARLWGETVAADDPEILESYRLLADLQKDGAAAVAAGREGRELLPECAAKIDRTTGAPLPANRQITADPSYTVRAWQGLVAYLLMDHRFLSEE